MAGGGFNGETVRRTKSIMIITAVQHDTFIIIYIFHSFPRWNSTKVTRTRLERTTMVSAKGVRECIDKSELFGRTRRVRAVASHRAPLFRSRGNRGSGGYSSGPTQMGLLCPTTASPRKRAVDNMSSVCALVGPTIVSGP